jgi:hypothetical protein
MAILSEALAIGIFISLLFGAACFYLYSRISYTEKRLSMMESLLVDIKMMMESAEHDAAHSAQVMPLTPAGTTSGYAGAPIDVASLPRAAAAAAPAQAGEAEEEDESAYAAVLEQAASGAVSGAVEPVVAEVEESTPLEKQKVGPNYDSMTRAELAALAEQGGIRFNKRAGRGELITLLRKAGDSKNGTETTGTENGSAGSLFPADGPLGGDLSLDSGNAGAALEEAAI